MIFETVCVGNMLVNCYILAKARNCPAIVIDPGAQKYKIRQVLDKYNLKPAFIVNTHGHYDHIGCDDDFGVPIYIHRQDVALLKDAKLNLSYFFGLPYVVGSEIRYLEESDLLELDGLELYVIHLPGHTPGGIALYLRKPKDKILFTGDSLFCQGIGRTDFVGADKDLLIRSIKQKLFMFDDDTVIYPGHGSTSTVGAEKRKNPYLT